MKTREITSHQVNECNRFVSIHAIDEPVNGANHRYTIQHPRNRNEPIILEFQNGPIADGFNGIGNECLLAVLVDRFEGFQSGPFACDENEDALRLLSMAMAALKSRTEKRVARGVEGTLTV